MPPSIPRAPLRSLTSSIPSTTSSISTTLRTFATTAPRLEVDIPPESPRFINLPDPPQSSERKLPPVKGVLPVPREIFHRRNNGSHKVQPGFVDQTVPKSKAELAGEEPRSEKAAWKRLMAESRRQALGAGISTLWERKQTREARAKDRAEKHRLRNLMAANAPERLDDVYTRGTVTQHTLKTKVIRDPLYKERQLESQARTAALQQARSETRKDALQRLYVEAGNFIVSEDELSKKVEEIFTADYFKTYGKQFAIHDAENVWDAHGPPITVKSMFASMKGTSTVAIDYYKSEADETTLRQRTVAGELTGGAMSAGPGSRRDRQ
ncbi:hypothetical protein VP1G_05944 [Cytospora mali]|uniref:Uncharacterized protein n=1 Tax=Cytospora mali TaxID=578113 RepID=A0A194V4D9_CYTMA|nr:hypothetical protein VP1G_05944 [Valsa mali var. pyri (nom. inval.)]